jgi:hypothetical protein
MMSFTNPSKSRATKAATLRSSVRLKYRRTLSTYIAAMVAGHFAVYCNLHGQYTLVVYPTVLLDSSYCPMV